MIGMKARRKEIGLTQKDLADLVGCNESAISQYESGKRQMSYETQLRVAEVLHMSVSELLHDPMALVLTPLQRQLVDATEGLPEDDMRVLIDVAARMKRSGSSPGL